MTPIRDAAGGWRARATRGLTDPYGPDGRPITTPADRRWLWHIAGWLTVAAASAPLRQLATDLSSYLAQTCEHHWLYSPAEDGIPPHRQCLWCHETESNPPTPPYEPIAGRGGLVCNVCGVSVDAGPCPGHALAGQMR